MALIIRVIRVIRSYNKKHQRPQERHALGVVCILACPLCVSVLG